MPIECQILRGRPEPFDKCPSCGVKPFVSFMRGSVQKTGFKLLYEKVVAWYQKRKPRYCSVICDECKEIVGQESCKLPLP